VVVVVVVHGTTTKDEVMMRILVRIDRSIWEEVCVAPLNAVN